MNLAVNLSVYLPTVTGRQIQSVYLLLDDKKQNEIVDAPADFCPGDGSEFEAYPLPSSRLGSSSLSASVSLGYLVGTF
jgi:hypothetical protein